MRPLGSMLLALEAANAKVETFKIWLFSSRVAYIRNVVAIVSGNTVGNEQLNKQYIF